MTKAEIWKTIGDAYNTLFENRIEEQLVVYIADEILPAIEKERKYNDNSTTDDNTGSNTPE